MSNALAVPVDYVPTHVTAPLFSSLRQRRPPTADDWQHNEFSFEPFVKRELGLRVGTDDEVCPRFAKDGSCALGSECPLRHEVTPSPPAPPPGTRDMTRRTVCKHWLRGLCKKGDACDYLHEYDQRRMPECRFYATFGFCNSAEECLYVHIDPEVKRKECELYRRGFCPKGPRCEKRHVRRIACPYYLAGFCPKGPECNLGHIKAMTPSPASRASSPMLTHRPLSALEAFGGTGAIQDLPTDRRGRVVATPAQLNVARAALAQPAAAAARDPLARRCELSDVLCYKVRCFLLAKENKD